ncbi:MAG TPA: glycosyltransferase family 1 protein [Aequorivita sp.]|nr:glycosyltransferase family 1 protein [Aequorivita sp.]
MEQEIISKEKKATRLLVDAHVFDGIFQGSRTFLKGVYSHFETEKYGVQVFLAANNIDNLEEEFANLPNIEFVQLKSTNKFYRLAWEIPKLIRDLQIDFAHFNYYLPLTLSSNCNYIITIHDVLFLDYPHYFPKSYVLKNKLLFGWAAKRAELLNSVSDYSVDRIRDNFNIPSKKMAILPNAIDERFFEDRSKDKDREYIKKKYGIADFILYVSRWEPRKNHIALLQAYSNLRLWEKNIELIFIGKKAIANPELDNFLQEVLEKSGQKVHHISYIDQDDLVVFNNAAQLSVFPSLCEGFGIPPLESAALRTPTICSNLTAMKEFSFFGKYHIDPRENAMLETSIEELLQEIQEDTLQNQLTIISETIRLKYRWEFAANVLAESIKRSKGKIE